MTAGLVILAVVAAVIVAATVVTAKAIHDAPVADDEPSQLDLWDRPDRKETDQ